MGTVKHERLYTKSFRVLRNVQILVFYNINTGKYQPLRNCKIEAKSFGNPFLLCPNNWRFITGTNINNFVSISYKIIESLIHSTDRQTDWHIFINGDQWRGIIYLEHFREIGSNLPGVVSE